MKTFVIVAFLGLGLLVATAISQDAPKPRGSSPLATAPSQSTLMPGPAAPTIYPEFVTTHQSPRYYLAGNKEAKATQEAFNKLKNAKTDDDRADARDALRTALEKQYDSSLDAYSKHLEELENKVAELKEQLRRRRRAKDEMVDLRLKMLVSEADGLGWPNSSFGRYWSSPYPTLGTSLAPPPNAKPNPARPPRGVR